MMNNEIQLELKITDHKIKHSIERLLIKYITSTAT